MVDGDVVEFGHSRHKSLFRAEPVVPPSAFPSDLFHTQSHPPASSVWPQSFDASSRGRGDVLGNGFGGESDAFSVKNLQEGLRAILPKNCHVSFGAHPANNMSRPNKIASPPAPAVNSKHAPVLYLRPPPYCCA